MYLLLFGQHEMPYGHTVICGMSGYTILLHIMSQTVNVSGKDFFNMYYVLRSL